MSTQLPYGVELSCVASPDWFQTELCYYLFQFLNTSLRLKHLRCQSTQTSSNGNDVAILNLPSRRVSVGCSDATDGVPAWLHIGNLDGHIGVNFERIDDFGLDLKVGNIRASCGGTPSLRQSFAIVWKRPPDNSVAVHTASPSCPQAPFIPLPATPSTPPLPLPTHKILDSKSGP